MRQMITRTMAVLALAGIFTMASIGPSRAIIIIEPLIFEFTGDCEVDCTGSASAVLTLDGSYELGTLFDTSDVIDFDFSSNSGVFDDFSLLSAISFASGTIDGTLNEFAPVIIEGSFTSTLFPDGGDFVFISGGLEEEDFDLLSPDALEELGRTIPDLLMVATALEQPPLDDVGVNGLFNASVPEPSAWSIFGLALLGMVYMRHRRRIAA